MQTPANGAPDCLLQLPATNSADTARNLHPLLPAANDGGGRGPLPRAPPRPTSPYTQPGKLQSLPNHYAALRTQVQVNNRQWKRLAQWWETGVQTALWTAPHFLRNFANHCGETSRSKEPHSDCDDSLGCFRNGRRGESCVVDTDSILALLRMGARCTQAASIGACSYMPLGATFSVFARSC